MIDLTVRISEADLRAYQQAGMIPAGAIQALAYAMRRAECLATDTAPPLPSQTRMILYREEQE